MNTKNEISSVNQEVDWLQLGFESVCGGWGGGCGVGDIRVLYIACSQVYGPPLSAS